MSAQAASAKKAFGIRLRDLRKDAGLIATVTMGPRSGCYLVRLPSAGVAAQTVNADQPQAVVDLVLAATRGDDRGRT